MTPQLGKRKRGSKDAQVEVDDGEPDELSPDQNNDTHSIERTRIVVGTVSPVREELDEEPDELSMMLGGAGSLREHVIDATADNTIPATTPRPPENTRENTPSAKGTRTLSIRSRLAARRSKSTDAPGTPSLLPNETSRLSSARFSAPETPSVAAEEEDELTPAPASVTPRVIGEQSSTKIVPQEEGEINELSSPAQPANITTVPTPVARDLQIPPSSPTRKEPLASAPAKRGRPRRILVDVETGNQSAPVFTKASRKRSSVDTPESADAEDVLDELSPEVDRKQRRAAERKQAVQAVLQREDPVEMSSAEEESVREQSFQEESIQEDSVQEEYVEEESVQEDEATIHVMAAPKDKPLRRAKSQNPHKKQRLSGPKQAISVMRIKGSTVRGVTVADTTRTMIEESIDHQVQRMAAKMETAEDPSRRKKLRSHINLALRFKESLVEKLMDLQDANDTLSAGFKKRKLLRKGNVERRKEMLAMQNSRHEVAVEMDDELAVYEAEKKKAEAKNKVSANMFDIEAAMESGRERARREGRENEGPERPLSMVLETVGRQVSSVGGGLLATIRHFNDGLERAADWLEGRA